MNCPICDLQMKQLLELPGFPLTEKYEPWADTFTAGMAVADQALHLCERCSHGALEKALPDLYGDDYLTRTKASSGASSAVRNFSHFINSFVLSGFDLVIDIGANDSTLLERFGVERVAVDPNASGNAFCVRETIEKADLSVYADRRKLIVSSHTIEHLERPEVLIGKAAQIMGKDDYFALQFPSLELLVQDARIDQIHHQHLHYFSQRSVSVLLYRHGLLPVAWRFDPSHWGALMVIAKKGLGAIAGNAITESDFAYAYESFISNIGGIEIPYGSVAYGASLMFPVLAHWVPELEHVDCIVDDDAKKNGLRYVNFNKKIVHGHNLLESRDVVITGISTKAAARALTVNAIKAGAERIILPLHTL